MAKKDLAVEQDELTENQDSVGEESAGEHSVGVEDESPEAKALARLKESIIVKRQDLGGLRVKLTVTVPRDTMDERLHEQYAELKREAAVPGFRKGHAPLKLIEKRFGGEVGEELKAKLISSGCLAAVERENLKTLGDPHLWVRAKGDTGDEKTKEVEVERLLPFEKALDHLTLPKDGPLTFACEVEIKPEFELPELTKIPVQRPNVSISDDDIDAELTRLVSWRGTFEPVDDGPVKEDDLLYTEMKMTVDGELVASEDNLDLPARDVRVQGVPIAGLGKALVGKKIGDGVNITAEAPDDHENIVARGKKAKFEFIIREIKRWQIPALDAELLSSFGYESEDDLRRHVQSSLETRLHRTLKEKMLEQIGERLVDSTSFDVPEGLSQRQADRAILRRTIELQRRGMPPGEVEKMADGMRGKAKEQVIRDLKLFFILEKVAEDRKIDVTEEELNGALAEIARATGKRFDRVRDELSKQDGLMSLYLRIRDEKVLESLLADAEISEVEGPERKSPPKETKKKSEKTLSPVKSEAKSQAKPAAKSETKAKAEPKEKPAAKKKK